MSSKKNSQQGAVAAAVARLFTEPPLNAAEIKARFHGLKRDDLRRALLVALEDDSVPAELGLLFGEAMRIVKPGRLKGRLSALVLDTSRPTDQRTIALQALTMGDKREAQRVTELLSPEDLDEVSGQPLVKLVGSLLAMEDPGEALREVLSEDDLAAAPVEAVAGLIAGLEGERAPAVDAAALYGPSLRAGLLQGLRGSLVPVIASDGNEEAAELLEAMREAAEDEPVRAACQAAVMRLRTDAANRTEKSKSKRTVMRGEAWVTTCDGQGAYSLVANIERGSGGSNILVNCCNRAAADVRDGFTQPDVTRTQVLELVAGLSQYTRAVPVPLEEAARLVQDAAARTATMGKKIPRDARQSVKIFGKIEAPELPPLPVEPAREIDRSHLTPYLEELHLRSWFFDEGDLSVGAVPPLPTDELLQDPAVSEAWFAQVARSLTSPEMLSRVTEMARHEARCRHWLGEDEAARVFAGAVVELEREGVEGSTLVRAILDSSLDKIIERAERDYGPSRPPIANPDLRRELRSRAFRDLAEPQGRDLARLDFYELAFASLERSFRALPGDRRPRHEDVHLAAFALASELAEAAIAGRLEGGEDEVPPTTKHDVVMQELNLSAEDAARVTEDLVEHALRFAVEVCAHCPVDCLSRPAARMGREFFSDDHPIAKGHA